MTNNNVASTDRARKSKALKVKRNSAEAKGVTIIDNAFTAVFNGSFSVYVWDGEDWTLKLSGTVTESFLEST